ncbi:MAG: ABC transporter ATP-binding protein [Calditrichia bacterium]
MIFMKEITKVYSTGKIDVHALRGIDLQINEGEMVAIMGPSGSGKSTLMNIIGCLDKPTAGNYQLDGIEIKDFDKNQLSDIRNKKIGFVFQNFNLLPYANAFENVELPLLFAGVKTASRKELVEKALSEVGLSDRMHHKPNELSGGQAQRVAIARALVTDPKLILADEPTGNLDSESEQEILSLFKKLHKEGKTIVVVTHDQNIADACERVIFLRDGQIISDVKNEKQLSISV